jgi:hypothetical protein
VRMECEAVKMKCEECEDGLPNGVGNGVRGWNVRME